MAWKRSSVRSRPGPPKLSTARKHSSSVADSNYPIVGIYSPPRTARCEPLVFRSDSQILGNTVLSNSRNLWGLAILPVPVNA
jgi:hypothetical protein